MSLEMETTANMAIGLGKTDGFKPGARKLPQSKLLGEETHVDGHAKTREEAERMETPTEKDGLLLDRRALKLSLFLLSISGLAAKQVLVRI